MIGMGTLQAAVALMAWTMIMWLWMYATRIPAINRLPKEGAADADVGWTGAKLEGLLPREIQWKAHNYNHLHEAPTVFYAVALTLFLLNEGDGRVAILGWAYVALRVVHSLVQVTVNKVMVRFLIFTLSTAVLMALTALAAMASFSAMAS